MDTAKTWLLIVAVLTGAATASWAGQTPSAATERPVSLSGLGGASAGSGNAGAAAGLTIGYDFSERVSLEGRGVYLDRGPGQMALDLNASLLMHLVTGRKVAPYVAVGGGLYRAMFDSGNQRSFGMMGGLISTNDMSVTYGQMPMFYARRMGTVTAPGDGRWHMQGFTDPALNFGGGVNIALTNSLYVRPDVRALMIVGGGDTYTIGSATFSLGFRF